MTHSPAVTAALLLLLLSPARQDKVLKGGQLTLVGKDKTRIQLSVDANGGLVVQAEATTLKLDGSSCKLRLQHSASVKREFSISVSPRDIVRMGLRAGDEDRFSVFGAALGSRFMMLGRGGSGMRIQTGSGSTVPLISADEADMSRSFSLGSPVTGPQILMSLHGWHAKGFLEARYLGKGLGLMITRIPGHGGCSLTTSPLGASVMIGRWDWKRALYLMAWDGKPAEFQISDPEEGR